MTTNDNILDRAAVVQDVNDVLRKFCLTEVGRAKECDPSYERLWTAIAEYVAHGGKRLRPYVVLLSYQAYGGRDVQAVLPAACAWEFLHAGMLVHDDIIDRDYVRHGHPNVSGVYRGLYTDMLGEEAEHYAAGAALMAGDLLLSSAQQIVLQSSLSAEDKLLTCRSIQDALFYVAGGELMDVETILHAPADVQMEKVARYKTARYSFELPLACGAALAGAPQKEQELLHILGKNLGIAYQIVDDILGVFGETKTTGKSNDGDLREKKRTLLIQETLQRSTPKQARRLNKLFGNQHEMSDVEIEEVRECIELSGAREAVAARAADYSNQALAAVGELHIDANYKAELRKLIEMLVMRVS